MKISCLFFITLKRINKPTNSRAISPIKDIPVSETPYKTRSLIKETKEKSQNTNPTTTNTHKAKKKLIPNVLTNKYPKLKLKTNSTNWKKWKWKRFQILQKPKHSQQNNPMKYMVSKAKL